MSRIARLLFILALSCMVLPDAAAAEVGLTMSGSVKCHALQEITFSLPAAWGNPCDPEQVAVNAVFRTPSGKELTVPAFFWQPWNAALNQAEAGEAWKVRFTPTEPGTHVVSIHVSRRSGPSAEIVTASFECVRAYATGFVRARGRYFALSTGEEFFPVGLNRPWGNAPDLRAYLREMKEVSNSGANCLRVWLAPWWLPIESKPGTYDQSASARLDAILAQADSLGLRVILCIEQHGNFEPEGGEVGLWNSHPYNTRSGGPCQTPRDFFSDPRAVQLFKNRLRYLVARWGYSPALMAWELFNEVEWIPIEPNGFWFNRNLVEQWHREMAQYLRAVDPFKHPIATSSERYLQQRLLADGALDFLQLHIYANDDLPGQVHQQLAWPPSEPRAPVLVGEFGVKKGSPAPHDVTRGIFAAGLSGGCGALPWLADAADFAAARERIRAARAFFEGVRWTQEKFAPTQPVFLSQPDQQENGVPALRAFAQVGQNEVHAFVYQVSDGPPQTLDPPRPVQLLIPGVAPGAYDLEFWSAVEGTILARQTVRAARQATKEAAEPAGIHVTLPWTGRDMAIKIIRAEPRP